jgi:putative acetyltransferase
MARPDSLRMARAHEFDAIDVLLRASFPGPEDAELVIKLRAAGLMEAEVVTPWEGGIVAYLALSRLSAPQRWLALAPVAVAPEWQGKQIGSRLVAGMLRLLEIKGQTTVVVGKPSFYARAGFSQMRAARLTSPYPLEFTLISRPGDDVPQETVIYPVEFGGV